MLRFEWLAVLWVLPLPVVLRYVLPPVRRAREAALKVPFYHELVGYDDGGAHAAGGSRLSQALALLAWALLVTAAARPQWLGEPVTLPTSGRDLMLAVDISGSMEYSDLTLHGRQADRLTVVKSVAGDFIERREGDRVGLVLFGSQAYLQTPLTFDRATTRVMLAEAEIGLAGTKTAIGDGIGLAIKRMRERPQESRVLILLTDGANTAGELDPPQAAKLAAEEGVRIYTIGVGAEEARVRTLLGTRTVNPSADLDEETLKTVAETTGGRYFRARDTAGLEAIYHQLDELEPTIAETETFRPTTALYPWPLAAALLLAALIGWRQSGLASWRRRAAI